MSGSDFLLTTWQGGGNVPPELGLARRLIQAGDRVHVLSEPSVESDATAAGCSFTPWPTAPSMNAVDRHAAAVKDWPGNNPISSLRRGGRLVVGQAHRWAHDVLGFVDGHRVDAVLVDVFQFGALIGAEAAGLPTFGLLPSIYIRPTRGHPMMGTGWLPATGHLGTSRDMIVPSLATRLLRLALPDLNAARADIGLAPVTDVFDLWDRCTRLLVMTSPSFDFPLDRLPTNVRYVGPITDDPPWAQAWTPPWPIDERPFVLVAMSSTYQRQDPILRRIIAALDGQPVYALLTLGPALHDGEVVGTSNVAVATSAPHSELLKRAAVAITHAGHGSVVKALAQGVPLVCMPQGRDQSDNTSRVVAAGAGVRLSRHAGVSAIRAAVQEVLGQPSYRANAQHLADAFAEEARHGANAVAEIHNALPSAID
jgi:MGT family glycosyltransferase